MLTSVLAIAVISCSAQTGKNEKVQAGRLSYIPQEEALFDNLIANNPEIPISSNKPSYEHVQVTSFDTLSDLKLALDSGKISFIVRIPHMTAQYMVAQDDSLTLVDTGHLTGDFLMALKDQDVQLQQQINQVIQKFTQDGTLKELEQKWIENYDAKLYEPSVTPTGQEGAIRIGVTGDLPPMDYTKEDGTPAGYSVALMQEISKELNRPVEFVPIETTARMTALQTGKIDIAFWFASFVNPSEMPELDGYVFTDSFYKSRFIFLTKNFSADDIRKTYGLEQ